VPYRATDRTEARRVQVRDRIVAAAEAQVAEGGYAAASVVAVAGRAHVATGTVYRHFSGKAELLGEVYRGRAERELALARATVADASRPAVERLTAAIESFARRSLAGPVLAYAMIAEPVDREVEAERLLFRRGYAELLAGVLRDGVAAGELPEQDITTAAACLVGAIGDSLTGPLTVTARPGDSARVVDALVAFCVGAVSAPGGSTSRTAGRSR
jgi:AcrR family transcriptional regulator